MSNSAGPDFLLPVDSRLIKEMPDEKDPACVRSRKARLSGGLQMKCWPAENPTLVQEGRDQGQVAFNLPFQDTQIRTSGHTVRCDTASCARSRASPRETTHTAAAELSSPGASLLRRPSSPTLSMTRWEAPPGTRPRYRRGRGDPYPRAPRRRRGKRDTRRLRHEAFHKSSTPPGQARAGYLLIKSSRLREPTATGRSAVEYAGSSN